MMGWVIERLRQPMERRTGMMMLLMLGLGTSLDVCSDFIFSKISLLQTLTKRTIGLPHAAS